MHASLTSSSVSAFCCQPSLLTSWSALIQVSCDAYRDVVRKDPRFIDFFSQSTPVSELGRMNIGSRPAKRKAAASIDSLRAIPWIFAWTQTRFHLPVWLGVGEAFQVSHSHPVLHAVNMCEGCCQYAWSSFGLQLVTYMQYNSKPLHQQQHWVACATNKHILTVDSCHGSMIAALWKCMVL